jgi:hypothetical protein
MHGFAGIGRRAGQHMIKLKSLIDSAIGSTMATDNFLLPHDGIQDKIFTRGIHY